MNNPNPFDDGFFATRSEGNLPFAPDSFLKSPVIKRAGDSWVTASVPRASIIRKPMRNMSCQPVTLNSFAAFADDTTDFLTSIGMTDPYAAKPASSTTTLIDPGAGSVTYNYNPNAGAKYVSQGVTQPASVSGSNILDAISGVIKGITPLAGQAVTAAAAGQSTTQQQQLLKQYLAGKLPGMVLNAQGQVVPASSVQSSSGLGSMAPILLGIGGLAVVMMMMSGGGNRGGGRGRR